MSKGGDNDSALRLIDAGGLGVCLALSAALYFVAVRPVLDEQVQRAAQAAELTEQKREAADLAAALADRRQTLMQTERQVAERSLKLMPLARLNHRLATVTSLANDCGLSLDRIEPGQSVPSTHYVSVPINLSGRGTYLATTQFLERMHEQWPDLAVASLDLRGSARGESDFVLQLLWFAATDQ